MRISAGEAEWTERSIKSFDIYMNIASAINTINLNGIVSVQNNDST